MYNPPPFNEDRIDVLHAFIRENPLATIVSYCANGLEATHVPVVLHPDITENGVLRCHFARANTHWKQIQAGSVLVIFQGAEHYISPSWYPSKQEHGKVVPTWNYVAVHVRGRATLFDDQSALLEHLRALTDQNEIAFDSPWSIDDAPKNYIESLSKAIVGIEITIDVIEGKYKVSQNRPPSDREGVVAGLSAINSSASSEMKQLVTSRGLSSGRVPEEHLK